MGSIGASVVGAALGTSRRGLYVIHLPKRPAELEQGDMAGSWIPPGTGMAMTLDVYADLFDDDLESVATALDAGTAAAGVGNVTALRLGRCLGNEKPPLDRGYSWWLRPASIR